MPKGLTKLKSFVSGSKGKTVSQNVSRMKSSARSSGAGAMASARTFAGKHKMGIGIGAGAAIGGSAIMKTRKSGLNKTPGRPTGMYKY
jgi:hypothetical protein